MTNLILRWDEVEVELVTPTGKRIGRVTATQSLQRIQWEGTKILVSGCIHVSDNSVYGISCNSGGCL